MLPSQEYGTRYFKAHPYFYKNIKWFNNRFRQKVADTIQKILLKKMITKQYKNTSFELTEVKEDNRQVSGYASVFNNVDSDNDVIKRGSYTRSIKSWGPEGKNRIKLVSQHDISRPVAKIDEMYEDEKGLFIKATFGTHTDGEDHYRMVKEGFAY